MLTFEGRRSRDPGFTLSSGLDDGAILKYDITQNKMRHLIYTLHNNGVPCVSSWHFFFMQRKKIKITFTFSPLLKMFRPGGSWRGFIWTSISGCSTCLCSGKIFAYHAYMLICLLASLGSCQGNCRLVDSVRLSNTECDNNALRTVTGRRQISAIVCAYWPPMCAMDALRGLS